jgi:hypothetical protein
MWEYEDSLAECTTMAPTYLESDLSLYLREDSGSRKKRKGETTLQHFILSIPLSTRTWVQGIHGLSQIRTKLTAFQNRTQDDSQRMHLQGFSMESVLWAQEA